MKIAVVSSHTPNYQSLADLTWHQNKKPYCEKHGYDAHARTDNFKFNPYNNGFDRNDLMIELLDSGKYDWVYAVGCDTMITNFNIRIEDLVDNNYQFIIATDCNGINADSFAVRNTTESINWFKNINSLQPKYAQHHWRDQQAMIDTLEDIKPYMKIVPQRHFNSYDYNLYPNHSHLDKLGTNGNWQHGDFLIHWPATTLEKRLELATEMLTKVIK